MPVATPTRTPAAVGRMLVQLTLDFFSPSRPAEPASADTAHDLQTKQPFAQTDAWPTAINNVAVQQVLSQNEFIHPRAARQVVLDGRQVGYALKRGKRRTIGFCVGSEGLAVSAPKWMPFHQIDQAVQAKASWILKKLTGTRERLQQIEAARTDWKEGACFTFLGQPVQIALVPGLGRAVLDADTGSANAVRMLRLSLPADAAHDQIRQAAHTWLVQQARHFFTARLDFFAPQLGVRWCKLGVSNATTRWGSASSSGAIRLNWRLMHLKPEVVDYVVVHELSHLRFMDHSPRFWATVESILPNHAALRQQLKKEPLLS